MDDKQYIQRERSIDKLYGWFCYTSQNQKRAGEENYMILEDGKEIQSLFQKIKMWLDTKEIPILGVVVRWGEVLMENNKTKTVKEWKTFINIKEVESFLEFTNFYKCFIKNFRHIIKPLNEFKSKKDWKWEEKHQKAFDKLKKKITS